MQICDQAVIDFLASTAVRKFPPRQVEERGQVEELGQVEGGQEERWQEQRGQDVCEKGSLGWWSLFLLISFVLPNLFGFHVAKGTMGSKLELRHVAGSPGGGGDIGSFHTLIRVHTV